MAELPRFFVPAETFAGDPIVIAGEPLHHLRSVLRLTPGSQVLLLDGKGGCYRARLVTVGRDRAIASVLGRWQTTETPCPLRLLQALPKGDRFDLVLQKGTELGVTTFQPLLSSRTLARADTSRRARWLRIISEAARQSRRPLLPELESLCPLSEALEKVRDLSKYISLIGDKKTEYSEATRVIDRAVELFNIEIGHGFASVPPVVASPVPVGLM